MGRLLVVVATGTQYEARALEGLQLAHAIHQIGMVEEVRVLLTGPGVAALSPDPEAERLHEALDALLTGGVGVAACTRSLNEHQLIEAAQQHPEVRPVGAPTYLSTLVQEDWRIVSF